MPPWVSRGDDRAGESITGESESKRELWAVLISANLGTAGDYDDVDTRGQALGALKRRLSRVVYQAFRADRGLRAAAERDA